MTTNGSDRGRRLDWMTVGTRARLGTALFRASIVFYLASLALPAVANSVGYVAGIEMALLGWFPMYAPASVFWAANPLLFLAWLSLSSGHPRRAKGLSAIAIVLMVAFLVHPRVPRNASGGGHLVHPSYGYFAWLASGVLTALAAHVRRYGDSR